jgi:hypothetical protein
VAIEIAAVTIENVAELRTEADEARHLASELDDPASVADLFEYAQSLEAGADYWELALLRRSTAA